MNKKNTKPTNFDDYLREKLKDPENKRLFDIYGRQLEISYQILQLRKKAKLSQKKLAQKIGTTQSNVARMESGNQNFTLEMLEKIARTFHKDLKVSIG